MWIERLDEELARNIQKACQPPNHKIQDVAYDRHLYAFVRRVPADEKSQYKGMSELNGVIALSRLINPTSTGDRYCAHVFRYEDKDSPIVAIRFRGTSPDVILAANSRDWLSVNEGAVLRKLMPWVSNNIPMHERVHRAYWNHENAMRSYYLDIRWTLIVSGFEALINTREDEVSWQFRDRVRQLAREFNVALSDTDLRLAYKLRSKLVHGQSFLVGLEKLLPQSQHAVLYEKLESLLRETVKRCLLDEKFGNCFRDDAAVEARWPLNPNPSRKPKKRASGKKP